jgi:hypothetical protein
MDKIPISDQGCDLLSEEICRAEEKTKKTKNDADEAARAELTWKDLKRYVDLGWPHHVLDLINKECNLFNAAKVANPSAGISIDEISTVVKESVIAIERRFPWLMQTDCEEAGLPIDPTSRHPKYTFMGQFFWVEIDEGRWAAKLSDYEGKLAEFPADIGAVISIVRRERDRVFNRPFDPLKFLNRVRKQYLSIIKKQNKKDGDILPIRQITHRLGKNFKGFRTDEFLIDLSRLIERRETSIDGRKMDLQQTKDTELGMLLHGAAGGGYIGFVSFKEV